MTAAQKLDELQPVHAGHVQVEQQATRLQPVLVAQEGHGGGIVAHAMAIGFDQNAHGIAHCLVVIHDANSVVLTHWIQNHSHGDRGINGGFPPPSPEPAPTQLPDY